MGTDPSGPPFFRSWTGAYLLVLAWLAALIAALAALTRMYE